MSDEIFYKVSFVVENGEYPGAIINLDERPQVGDEVTFDGRTFTILEVMELMPPIGNFCFLHVTCRYARDEDEE